MRSSGGSTRYPRPPTGNGLAHTLGGLAELLDGQVKGDPMRGVRWVRTLEEAGPEDLSFLTQARYLDAARASAAGAVLCTAESAARLPQDALVVADPQLALARLLELFAPPPAPSSGIHASAVVASGARVDVSAAVGPLCVVGEGAVIGPGARLEAHVVVGEDCEVGAGSVLHPHVTLYPRSVVGARCILHSGVVLGGDGFGFATSGGVHHKLAHLGRAVLEDDVEVGANSAIDRGLLGDTRIGAGTKIDDLVMIAHNVQVGRGCLLVAQAGIAGSARLGDGVTVAGQSGIIGHVEIGDGVVVATKSAVLGPVESGRRVAGIPATDLAKWRRQQALVGRLGELRRRLLRLEKRLGHRESEEEE
jgi:UDP-3-O-[3-hydroxymyristoyl] glucosamine N-acyltransferase